jgi:hypothetical protein
MMINVATKQAVSKLFGAKPKLEIYSIHKHTNLSKNINLSIFRECYSIKPISKKNKTSKKGEFVGSTLKKLENAAENQKSVCLRTLGKNFDVHRSTIGKVLKK